MESCEYMRTHAVVVGYIIIADMYYRSIDDSYIIEPLKFRTSYSNKTHLHDKVALGIGLGW